MWYNICREWYNNGGYGNQETILFVFIMALLVYGNMANAISNKTTPMPAKDKIRTQKEFDYSKMTNEELQTIIDKATEELNNRKSNSANEYITTEEGWLVSDRDGVKITVTNHYSIEKSYNTPYLDIYIYIIIENKSDNEVQVNINNMSINGWQVSDDIVWDEPVKPGLKSKQKHGLNLDDANVSNIEDIDVVEFSFVVKNYTTGKLLYETQALSLTMGQ